MRIAAIVVERKLSILLGVPVFENGTTEIALKFDASGRMPDFFQQLLLVHDGIASHESAIMYIDAKIFTFGAEIPWRLKYSGCTI